MNESDRTAQALNLPAFPRNMGIELLEVGPERVTGQLVVTQALANRNNVMHGGALMSLADTLAGTGAVMNLAAVRTTTTIESKSNFLRAIPVGQVALGTSVRLNDGQMTSIWQTKITRPDGKLSAIVTQTQLVIDWREVR